VDLVRWRSVALGRLSGYLASFQVPEAMQGDAGYFRCRVEWD